MQNLSNVGKILYSSDNLNNFPSGLFYTDGSNIPHNAPQGRQHCLFLCFLYRGNSCVQFCYCSNNRELLWRGGAPQNGIYDNTWRIISKTDGTTGGTVACVP